MKQIPLTQGKFALVDDEDYEWLMQWKWHYQRRYIPNKQGDARRRDKNRRIIFMHREIIKPPKNLFVDHINHNSLDNRKCNLRFSTRQENGFNRISAKHSSIYKGVSLSKCRKKWVSQIKINKKVIYLGTFESEMEAAEVYYKRAKEIHKHFLCIALSL